MSWAARYIGLPWVAGQTDCWSFVRLVWAERFGVSVPPVAVDPADARAGRLAIGAALRGPGWTPVAQPVEGDGVLMARGRHPCHVGIWAAGGVLHALEVPGVIHSPAATLERIGYRVTGYWRPACARPS